MNEILVSVVVPIFNAEKYLHQCIRSILEQTYYNLELILVNDGSIDNSALICEEYKEKDKRVKVINKENEGVIKTRNIGIDNATGEYLMFVDADDWIEEQMLEQMVIGVKNQKVSMVLCGMKRIGEKDISEECLEFEAGFYDKERIKKKIVPYMLFTGTYYKFGINPAVWAKLYNREIICNLKKVNPNIIIGEDSISSYACILDSKSIVILQECYYCYRQNNESVTKKYNEKMFENLYLLMDGMREVLDIEDENMMSQYYYYCTFMIMCCVANEGKRECRKKFSEKKHALKINLKKAQIDEILQWISIKEIKGKDKYSLVLLKHHAYTMVTLLYWIKNVIHSKQ